MAFQCISLASIIDRLCHSGKLREAVRIILSHKLEPNQYSIYSKILQLCADFKSRECGYLIHSRIIIDGLSVNNCLNTGLMIFYSKLGGMESSRKVFDQISERSVVTWTALISGYCHNEDNKEALRVFSAMHVEGIRANQFTYGSALSACTRLPCLKLGLQIQGRVQKGRFVGNLFVQSALVDFHSKCGKMVDACSVFESMEMKDLVSWNSLIGGYTAQGLSENAITAFCLMLREGILPDSFSFGNVLRASFGNDGLTHIYIIHGYVFKFGFGSHKFVSGTIVDAYVRCGSIASAYLVYNSLKHIDVVSCTALIRGYSREGTNLDKALSLFIQMQRNMAIDDVLLCSMLNICAKTASLILGKQLHAHSLKYRFKCDIAMENALIDMYSRSGEIEDARLVFDEMEKKNVISWTSLIAGYGKHGHCHGAFELYAKMEEEGLQPNNVTFLSLLFACSHNGSTTKGWECFRTMVVKHNILPRPEHYSCLVDILARTGHLEEAYDLVCKLPCIEDTSVLSAILGGCSTHDKTVLGQRVAKSLFSLEPENPANYVVLSGIYASAGLWSSARDIRKLMEKKISSKCPGYSLYQSTSSSEGFTYGLIICSSL